MSLLPVLFVSLFLQTPQPLPHPEIGRYQVVVGLNDSAIMVDTAEGKAWVLNYVGPLRYAVFVLAPRFDTEDEFRKYLSEVLRRGKPDNGK